MAPRALFCSVVLLVSLLAPARPGHALPPLPDQVLASFDSASMASLSPLLYLGLAGLKARLQTPDGTEPPFYARNGFLVFAWLLLVVLLCKDTLGDLLPAAKKPLDALDVVQNKVMVLVVGLALLPDLATQTRHALSPAMTSLWNAAGPPLAFAAPSAGYALPAPPGWLETAAWWLSYGLSLAVFYTLWSVSHIVNIVSLIAPVPLSGSVLKCLRLGLLAALAAASAAHPALGAAAALALVYPAIRMTGWAHRLMVFASLCSYDILTLRWARPLPGGPVLAFSSAAVPGLPRRVLGRLSAASGRLRFTYRPLFVLPARTKDIAIPESLAVTQALACPMVITQSGPGRTTLFALPPRYRSHVRATASRLGCAVAPSGFGRGIKAALGFLETLFRPIPA